MRRLLPTACSLLLSGLAFAGGPASAMLCLNQAGFHLSSIAASAEDERSTACANDAEDSCAEASDHQCERCVDVTVKGLDLAQQRFEGVEDLLLAPTSKALVGEEELFQPALASAKRRARGPPIPSCGLIAVRTSVLLV